MRTKIALISSLAALGALLPAAAFAQDPAPQPVMAPAPAPAPAAAATPEAPTAGPGAASASTETATPDGSAPAATPAPEEAPAAGPKPAPGWMRIDSDFFGLQLWGGGTLPITEGLGLAMDIYTNALVPGLTGNAFGEFDIGPAITAGPFTVTPMIGLQVDFAAHKAAALVPQLYVTGGPGPIYAELWFQYYAYKMFDGLSNQINSRLFVDYKISDYIAFGPEVDLHYDSNGLPDIDGKAQKIYKLPVGGNLMFSNLGANSTLIAFLGYDLKDPAGRDNHLGGRLTYIHNF